MMSYGMRQHMGYLCTIVAPWLPLLVRPHGTDSNCWSPDRVVSSWGLPNHDVKVQQGGGIWSLSETEPAHVGSLMTGQAGVP